MAQNVKNLHTLFVGLASACHLHYFCCTFYHSTNPRKLQEPPQRKPLNEREHDMPCATNIFYRVFISAHKWNEVFFSAHFISAPWHSTHAPAKPLGWQEYHMVIIYCWVADLCHHNFIFWSPRECNFHFSPPSQPIFASCWAERMDFSFQLVGWNFNLSPVDVSAHQLVAWQKLNATTCHQHFI